MNYDDLHGLRCCQVFTGFSQMFKSCLDVPKELNRHEGLSINDAINGGGGKWGVDQKMSNKERKQ